MFYIVIGYSTTLLFFFILRNNCAHYNTWMMTSSLSCSTASCFSTFDFGRTWKQQWNTSTQSFLKWIEKVFLALLTTHLNSKDLVFPIVLHLYDGSIWAFSNEAQDLTAQEWSNPTVSATSASNELNRLCSLSTLPENGPVLEIDSVGIQAKRRSIKTPQWSRGQLLQDHNMQTTERVSEPKRRPCQSGAHD